MQQLYVYFGLGANLVAVSLVYRWFLRPVLARHDLDLRLQLLLLVHCFRFISPISLVAGVTLPGLSPQFTYPQVAGDVATALFALIGIHALRSRWRLAIPWVWLTNLFGVADLVVIGIQGTRFHFADHVGAMFYIVSWYVPWLLLSHGVIFGQLMRREPAAR